MFTLAMSLLLAAITAASAQPDQPLQSSGINLESIDYPYPVHFHDVAIQGQAAKMAYMDVQPEHANGQTIVLLHGKNFCGAYWARPAQDLAALGYRVLIPDQVGWGKSTKPDIQYTFQMLAQNTAGLLDSLGVDHTVLLGHSMGGMLATRFTLMYPARVDCLILEDPIGLEDWKRVVPYRSVAEWEERELKSSYESLKEYETQNYYHMEWKPEYEPWLRILAAPTLSPDYPRLAHINALTSDMIFTQPVCYEFDLIQPPTLLMIGTLDRTAIGKDKASPEVAKTLGNYPELGRKTAQAIPHAKLVAFEGVGHLPHIEAYDRFFNAVKDFLPAHTAASR